MEQSCVAKLKGIMKVKGMDIKELSERTKIPARTLYRRFTGDSLFLGEEIWSIADALEIKDVDNIFFGHKVSQRKH